MHRWLLTLTVALAACRADEPPDPSPVPDPEVAAPPGPAAAPDPRLACLREHPADPTHEPVVRALCAELHGHQGVSASVAIAEGDRVVWSTAIGPRCQNQDEPLLPTTAVGIGSITKLLTAALALEVAAREGVGLDDPLALPEISPPPSLRSLLTHTAGLRDPEPSVVLDRDDWSQTIAEQRRAPGPHVYANAGFLLVGRWLEHTTGRSYADLFAQEPSFATIRERVALTPRSAGTIACGHRPAGGWEPLDPTAFPPLPAFTLPAGGGLASAEDLARLPAALARTGHLSAMVAPRVPSDRTGWDYGLGVRIKGQGDDLWLAHSGNTGTYWAELQWSAHHEIAVAVVSTTPQAFEATMLAAITAATAR